jgi:hypothetical protein
MEEENKPMLEEVTFKFSQDGNCVDGGDEFLEIRCDSSLGIDRDKGCFFILKTEQWAVESADDLQELFNRIKKIISK